MLNLRAIFGGMLPLFVLGHFGHHVMTTVTVPLIPFIRNAFDLDYAQSGFVLSAFQLAYGFGQLPAGWLADRFDPRTLMTIGISGVALAGVLVGVSHAYSLMIVFLVLMGILAGGYHPSAPPLISASVKPNAVGRAFGLHNIGGGASHFLTPLVAVAITNVWGWRNAYIALGVPAFLFGIIFYKLLGRLNAKKKQESDPRPREGLRALTRPQKIRIVIFLTLTTFVSAIVNSVAAFVPLLMVDHFGVSKEMAAGSLSIIYSAVFWASPLGGYLADRFGSIRMVLMACFIAGPTIFLLTVVPYGFILPVLLLIIGAVIYTRMTSAESFLVHQTPAGSRSTILGIYYFTGMESGGVLMPVVGLMIDHLGFTTAFAASGGLLFLATLACWFGFRKNAGTQDEPIRR